ncbi:hypothetical protein CesoFtcFv8_022609 [Champsocephalus esox]|uniref:Uncharacterized protein n=1 Tax=Champsocephalus esox TaxID=159716 RepID=A0AAN8B6I7_9TELE|nr:hypothetical protein CesoFtcFv8_022609 [Champsocephalus esox]
MEILSCSTSFRPAVGAAGGGGAPAGAAEGGGGGCCSRKPLNTLCSGHRATDSRPPACSSRATRWRRCRAPPRVEHRKHVLIVLHQRCVQGPRASYAAVKRM